MKNLKKIVLSVSLVIVTQITKAQDCGELIIKNAPGQQEKFIASINGVRIVNSYSTATTFNCLEDLNYKIQFLIAGLSSPLQFTVSSMPNYVSNYILNKDMFGKYSLILESKSLMGIKNVTQPTETPTLTPTFTANSTPTVITTTTIVNTNTTVALTPTVAPLGMNDAEFNGIVNMLKKESIESNRLDLAKNFLKGKPLSTAQVVSTVRTLNIERNKTDLAKHLYAQTVDRQNYFNVMTLLNISSSKRELSEYISKFNN
ncbi:MAG: DUF4476 domain-containing protein [Bacteroidota bacterium]|jgi:hypothetical protein